MTSQLGVFIGIALCFLVVQLCREAYWASEDQPITTTVEPMDKRIRRDYEIECSMYRIEKIRVGRMPEGVRQHLLIAATLELQDLCSGKQRPWKLDRQLVRNGADKDDFSNFRAAKIS